MISKSLRVSKKIEEKVVQLIEKHITFGKGKSNLNDYMHGVVEQVYTEEQDATFLTIGRTGYGKSNFSAILNVGLQVIIRQVTGRKRYLDFAKNVYWSGLDYVRGMQPMVLDIAKTLINKGEEDVLRLVKQEGLLHEALNVMHTDGINKTWKKLRGLEAKYGYGTNWLDEAQDLNSMETMNTFNRELIKIKSGTREMNQIDTICIPNPWLLSPYIREEKVNTVFFVFPIREREKGRAMRKVAVYDLSRYHKLIMTDGRYIRRLMTSPLRLIDRFKPALMGNRVPLFPQECDEWKTYKIMKKLATVKLPLQGIEKIEAKYGLREKETGLGFNLCCPKCGKKWKYRGKKRGVGAYITCPVCRTPGKLKNLTENYFVSSSNSAKAATHNIRQKV